MNGIHDMGGMDGFGKVEPDVDEPVFHAPWEGRVVAIMRAMAATGAWNIDMFRATREGQRPEFYLTSSYYKSRELIAETLLLDRGLVTPAELAAGRATVPARPLPRDALRASNVPAAITRGRYERPSASPARFAPGDRVRTKNLHPTTHTRLPRYARGRVGVIERVLGCQVYPDSSALGNGDDPQWLYVVVFEGRELWGADGDPTLKVSIDAFEPYMELA